MLSNPWAYFSKHPFHLYDEDESSVQVTAIALCEVADIIAIATSNGRISFFNSEGEKHVTRNDIASKESYYCQLVWKPHGVKQLIGGRADGQVFSWVKDDHDGSQRAYIINNDHTVHKTMIRYLRWNDAKSSETERLLSIDHGGTCCIWKTDENELVPIAQIDSGVEINSFAILPEQFCINHVSSFVLGSTDGRIYHFDEHGKRQLVYSQDLSDSIDYILCDKGVNDVIVITRSLVMFQFSFERDGSTVIKTTARLKIEGLGEETEEKHLRDVILTNSGQLVALTEKGVVQSWDLRNDETCVLEPLKQHDSGKFDPALSIAYSFEFDTLVVGTQGGRCIFWKDRSTSLDYGVHQQEDTKWLNTFYCDISDHCRPDAIKIGKTVLIQSSGNMLSLKQNRLLSVHKDGKAALQIDQQSIVVFHDFFDKPSAIFELFMNVEGLAIDSSYVCVWSHQDIQVYYVEDRRCEIFSEISLPLETLVIVRDTLYIAQGRSLLVTDLYGAQRLTIRLPEGEGSPQHLDATSTRLVICTDNGTVRVMDTTKKEPQLLFSGVNALSRCGFPVSSVLSIKCNADCTILSIMSTDQDDDSRRRLHFFEIKTGASSSIENTFGKSQSAMSHFWDPAEPRVFSCEIRSKDKELPRVLTLFIGSNADVLLHNDAELASWSSIAAGISVPCLFTLERNHDYPVVTRRPDPYLYLWEKLKGFESCDIENSELISAITDFSFYVASEDIDKAFICATSIKDNKVWETLAAVCVHNGNINVAKQCLVGMGREDAIAAVKDAEKNPEVEVPLAEAAIQLKMMNEAESLYRKCNRLDLLCDLFRQQGLWSEAFEVAKSDALLEKSLHFFVGKSMEERRDIANAFVHYEKSSLSKSKVLLQKIIQHGLPVDNFLRRTDNNELISLHASHLETLGDIPQAKTLYSTADDTLNLVRLACAEGNLEHAFELVKGGFKAGAYHLARHLESEGDLSGALACYSMSGMYNYAIRVCKANVGFDNEMINFAMKSQTPQVLSCAHYFFQKGELEKAARLYAQGGRKDKAIEIMSQVPLDEDNFHVHTEYASLIEELDVSISKDTIQKYAKYLIKTGKSERALKMLKSKGSSIPDLLNLCLAHNIKLGEELSSIILSEERDESMLKAVAHVCRKQGTYKLACKMFTQAGDRINAIKSLLSTGDVQNIITYANASRSKDVYILTANHLQKLQTDDQNDPKMKKIMVQFYTKARAYEQLISLLLSWSDYETADGDYELASKWLKEAKKIGRKIDRWDSSKESRQIDEDIKSIDDFLSARENSSTDPDYARAVCMAFLKEGKSPIQTGDCYALLLELEDDCSKAYEYIQTMTDAGIAPEEFIDEETIISIYKAVNKNWQGSIIDDSSTLQDQSQGSEDSLESSGILTLDEKDREVMGFAINRDWNPVRELIADRGSGLSLKLVCSIFTTGPPQSVAVAIMRVKPGIFSEKDEIGRYPLHYLAYHGAPTYSIIFALQHCKSALGERDEDGKTPLDHVQSMSWEHCQEDQDEVIAHLQSISSK